MKIVYVTPEYIDEKCLKPFDGGLASYLNKITQLLAGKGHEIVVLMPNAKEAKTVDYKGVRVIFEHSQFKKTILHRLVWPFLSRKTKQKLKSEVCYQTIHKVLQKENSKEPIDIIQYASYLAMGKYPEKNIPSCVRLSSYAKLWQKNYNYSDPQEIENEIVQFQNARFIYGPSKYIADYIKQDLNLTKEIRIIETPFVPYVGEEDSSVYEDLNKQIQGCPYLLFFGSIGLLKGAQELADSMPSILEKYPDLHLVLVGKEVLIDGKSPTKIIQARAGVNASRVIRLSRQGHATLFPLIRHAKAVLLPSRVDNLPNTCIEAMGLKKVVIGARGASFEQLLEDDVSGLLCQAGDAKSIEVAVDRLMALSDKQIQKMTEKAYERSLTLSMDAIVPQVLDYYRYVIQNWRQK